MTTKSKRPRRQIGMKAFKRKMIFWTAIVIVVVYAILFTFAFTSNAHAATTMKCNDDPAVMKMMNWNEDKSAWEEATFFSWPCSSADQNLIEALLINILNWLAVGVSIAVVGGVIYGAVLYTSAGCNTEQTKRALNIIRNAFIALVMYFAMWAFLNWLVPGGLFN